MTNSLHGFINTLLEKLGGKDDVVVIVGVNDNTGG